MIIIALTLLVFGCTTTEKTANVNYFVVHAGKEFSKPLRGAKIFNSASEYRGFLMARAIKANDVVDKFDFEKKSLLVVFLGKRAEEGYGLKINNIEDADKIIVRASETLPKESDAPQYFLAIDKTDKKKQS